MARPIKEGLDYFPLDVALEDDVELLEAECGLEGFAILIKLYQKIYQNSFYIKWGEDNALLFARKINVELTKVNDVINVCFKRDLFNKSMHKDYKILTSCGIQKRFFKIYNDARRKGLKVNEDYLLVNDELIGDNVIINDSPDVINDESSTQSKGEYSKEEKSKEEKQKNIEIFDYWQSKDDLYEHSYLTKGIIKQLNKLPAKNKDDVLKAIDRYRQANNDKSYYYNHIWKLDLFLKQGNGYPKWLDDGEYWINYEAKRTKKKKVSSRKGILPADNKLERIPKWD